MIPSPPFSFNDGGGLPIGFVFMKHAVSQDGFTLVELIVTIMVAAILGVMFVQVMETSLTGSVQPLTRTQHMFEINGVMENITRDYNKLMETSATPLFDLQNHIGAGNEEGNTPYFGPYTVVHNNYIKFESDPFVEDKYIEVDSVDGTLKVIIADINGEHRLTALFAK